MTKQEMTAMARIGLDAEIARLTGLRASLGGGPAVIGDAGQPVARRRRRKFSLAERRAISKRMKETWAARKARKRTK